MPSSTALDCIIRTRYDSVGFFFHYRYDTSPPGGVSYRSVFASTYRNYATNCKVKNLTQNIEKPVARPVLVLLLMLYFLDFPC